MRLFLISLILLAASASTGDARHMSLECNKDREGQTWHEGAPYARICCLLSNNQYEEIAGNSCPNIQGRCGAGEMECAGPGPRTRCVPRGECNPMRSSLINWLMPSKLIVNSCKSNADCGRNGMPSGVCTDAGNGKKMCMIYIKAPARPTATPATEPKNMTPCIN